MQLLDIAEVAAQAGIPASALRYYEEKRLIASVGRRGLRRLFTADVLEKLSLIALGREAGFTLKEMAAMFSPDGRLRIRRDRLVEKADEIDRTIRRLMAMRDGLRHAAVCKAPSHLECPSFRRRVQAAGKRSLRKARQKMSGR